MPLGSLILSVLISDGLHGEATDQGEEILEQAINPLISKKDGKNSASIEHISSENESPDMNEDPNLDHVEKEQAGKTLNETENATEQNQASSEDNSQEMIYSVVI